MELPLNLIFTIAGVVILAFFAWIFTSKSKVRKKRSRIFKKTTSYRNHF